MRGEIDAIVCGHVDAQGPGVAVAVARDGEVIHCGGYGQANLEWSQTIGPDTVFGIGSLTKPFTAMAILLLEREGRLRLDDEIGTHLPGYDTHGAAISLAHLLTHTSGVPNYVTRPGFFAERAPLETPPSALRALFEPLPLDFAPGMEYRYSNSGYALLGMVIEAVSGTSYGTFVGERIFEPLGMRRTSYLRHEPVVPRRADGYERAEVGGYERAPYISATLTYAGGGLASTVEDLLLWDQALRESQLLDAATLARMWTPLRLSSGRTEGYGLGWALSTYRGRRAAHHAGGVPGYSAFFGRFIEEGLTVIVLSNLGGYDAKGLARAITNELLRLPEPVRTPIAVEDAALERVVGTYQELVARLEVVRDGGRLWVRGSVRGELVALDERTFALVDDPDVTLTFEDERGDQFHEVRVVAPFSWYNATRAEE